MGKYFEPWKFIENSAAVSREVDGPGVLVEVGTPLEREGAFDCLPDFTPYDPELVARVVACVNACAGVSDTELSPWMFAKVPRAATIEGKIAILTRGRPNTLSITLNDHWSFRESIEEYYGEKRDNADFIDEAERQLCILSETVWSVVWFSETPVGHYDVLAATLSVVLNRMLQIRLEHKIGYAEWLMEFLQALKAPAYGTASREDWFVAWVDGEYPEVAARAWLAKQVA